MPARSQWPVAEPRKFTFDEPVTGVDIRVVGGSVNVVGSEGPVRLHIEEVHGPPLTVGLTGSTLSVAYDDLRWQGFLSRLDRAADRSVTVSLTVPPSVRLRIGAVAAATVVSGVTGGTELRGVSGDSTLVGLAGRVRADTVSGRVEAQGLAGDLRFNSVSGDLTVIEGAGRWVRADTVSGTVVLDLATAGRDADVRLKSVSGDLALRLPDPADAAVDASTAGGAVSSDFGNLALSGHWGARKLRGRLGAGNGRLRAASVSGAVALLRRPDPAEDGTAPEHPPGPDTADLPGPAGSPDPADPADSPDPTDSKKVL
ncbi:DUF4097 family beta strand repeat-containing protein [Streptomyces zingiberis]|uniref:DUF4097 domain-containing protein n=1 Tax=Streptomyces zingiberis TaxID=2053010 RepID=A0ABX1BT47_9ACTN|nr:DUF4097 family beta strand repeat-containing protein [Streptomyces zingiberis]NJQ00887.1 DUF4097 domain-containing protein [Streptomyces zingiberis]